MENRSVPLVVGNKSYPLLTSLDEKKLKAVYEILRDVVDATPQTLDQDQRLFIACMTLSDAFVSVASRLEKILSERIGVGEGDEDKEETGR
jgi:hypothetical protein